MAKSTSTSTNTTTTTIAPASSADTGTALASRGSGSSGSGLSDYGAIDVTDIFGPIITRDGKPHRISISGDDLNGLMASPNKKLYVGRSGDTYLFSLAPAPGKVTNVATPAIANLFGKNAAGRREGLLRLQYYMEMAGAYSGGLPVLGTWGEADYQALAGVLSNLSLANSKTKPRADGKGFAKPQLTLGTYLKDQTEKALALAKDALKRAGSGGGATIRVTDTLAGESALDNEFRKLTGRTATKAEKDTFTSAFRTDEIAAQRSASSATASPEQQQVNALTALSGQYDQSVVDPLVKFEHQWVRASDVPAAGRAAIATKYGVDYTAIAKFYASNPTLTSGGSGGGGGGIVEVPDLGARAEASAKASSDYMPYQIGSRGQDFLQALSRPVYQTNADIRS